MACHLQSSRRAPLPPATLAPSRSSVSNRRGSHARPRFLTGTVALGLLLAGSLAAQQAAAPKDATGQCTDSTYTTAKTRRGPAQARRREDLVRRRGFRRARRGRGPRGPAHAAPTVVKAAPIAHGPRRREPPRAGTLQPDDVWVNLPPRRTTVRAPSTTGPPSTEVHVGGGCQGGGVPSIVREGVQLRRPEGRCG